VGDCAARGLAAARSDSICGCLPAPSSSLLFDCQRSPACAGRSSGRDESAGHADAPVAVAIERVLGRGRTSSVLNRAAGRRRQRRRPETSKGRLVFPGGPSAQMMVYITCLENLRGDPPPYPDRGETRYRRAGSRAVRGSGRSWSGTATPQHRWRHSPMVAGYVLAGVTRVFSGVGSDGLSSRTAMRTER
jgi:hypothetical protein